jgi:PKD repeat protein
MAPTRLTNNSDTGRERAVSEVIGAIMLVSVVVIAVAVIGVALTSQGTIQKIPALDAIISNYGNTIQIYHNGGDTLQSADMEILVDGKAKPFSKGSDPSWTSWSAGDSLVYTVPDGEALPKIVNIVFTGGGASTVLTTADFSATGMINNGPISTDTLKAAFSGSPVSGIPPLVVQFTDQSTGYPVGWTWDFGDGTSTVENPTHVYNSANTYTVRLTVTNFTGNTDSTTHTITVSSYSPTVSGISPGQGIQGSSVPISMYGNNFVNGATITLKNQSATITATSVAFVSATTLTGTVVIPSGATLGPWDVVVTNPDMQTGTFSNGFTIYPPAPAPTFTSIAPAAGPAAGSTPITIVGSNFVNGGSFGVTIGGAAATSVVRVDATHITAFTPPGTAGANDVVITNNDGQTVTGAGAYTYTAVPTFTSIAPLSGTTLGGTAVMIFGTNLIGATGVTLGGTPATGVTVVSDTSITATTPGHTAGAVDVVVTTPNGTATGSGTYTYGAAPPTFTSIAPVAGPIAGGTSVTITGSGFTGATAVTFGGNAATGVTVVSDTSITATTPFHSAGAVDVVVTTPGGTATGTSKYTYTTTAAPTFTSIAPASGPTAGVTAVTITGTNFVAGGSLGVTIDGVAATNVTRTLATRITASTPAGTAGAKDVVITNNDGQTVTRTGAYTYLAVPTFTGIAPAAGPITLGTPVTITGTGFTGATGVTLGGTAATAVTVISDTSITATAPAHAAGVVNVVVTTPGGTATGTGVYTYTAAPTTTIIAPAYGRINGGTAVTITGTNFVTGATAVTFGGTEATTFTVVSATSITATTPAHAAGAGNVIVTTPGGASAARAYTYADPTISGALSRITGTRGSTYTGITIPGTNFINTLPNPTVTFTQGSNTMTGTVTACTATQVTFSLTIPSGQATGLYDVTVTNNDGGSVTRTSAFSVT